MGKHLMTDIPVDFSDHLGALRECGHPVKPATRLDSPTPTIHAIPCHPFTRIQRPTYCTVPCSTEPPQGSRVAPLITRTSLLPGLALCSRKKKKKREGERGTCRGSRLGTAKTAVTYMPSTYIPGCTVYTASNIVHSIWFYVHYMPHVCCGRWKLARLFHNDWDKDWGDGGGWRAEVRGCQGWESFQMMLLSQVRPTGLRPHGKGEIWFRNCNQPP